MQHPLGGHGAQDIALQDESVSDGGSLATGLQQNGAAFAVSTPRSRAHTIKDVVQQPKAVQQFSSTSGHAGMLYKVMRVTCCGHHAWLEVVIESRLLVKYILLQSAVSTGQAIL